MGDAVANSSGRRATERVALGQRSERRVGVFLNLLTHLTRSIAAGFTRYASKKGNWSVVLVHEGTDFQVVLGDDDFSTLDGLIVGYAWEKLPPVKCPVVYAHTPGGPPSGPTVCPDNNGIGRLGADHLLSLGLPYFAFVGLQTLGFSVERQQGFEQALAAHHRTTQPPMLFATWHEMAHGASAIKQWLSSLLLPCAVFCADDRVAGTVAAAAREAGVQVPEQLAILGVNDDDLACTATIPALSSIRINGEQIGYEAARLLERSMLGKEPRRPTLIRVPPSEVVQRGSTQILGYDDLAVCEAMRLIRTRAPHEPVTVDQIAAELRVHRQQLSRSFSACVGHPPKEEIDRVRADRIRALLIGSEMPVKQIAYDMGFSSPSQLIRFCHRILGKSPSELRGKT